MTDKEYRISLTKEEWGYVRDALQEYIDKYQLDSPNICYLDEEEEEMATCALNALEVINDKFGKID